MKRNISICLSLLLISCGICKAQIQTSNIEEPIGFKQYLELVTQNNLEYAAEKFNIEISEAAVELAKVFPNPSLSFDWANYSEGQSPTGYGFTSELSTTVELGGKRKARIELAKSEVSLSKALLKDYFRNLRAEAAHVYLEAINQKQHYNIKQNSYETMKRLSEADSIRLLSGSIMQTDAIQSKLEAGILLNELLQEEVKLQTAMGQLKLFASIIDESIVFKTIDTLKSISQEFKLTDLINKAQQNRSDLEAARFSIEASSRANTLVRKERKMDLDLSLGYGNEYFIPSVDPSSRAINGIVAIPLRFSNFNKGDLKIAELHTEQAQKIYSSVEVSIVTEITQAFHTFKSAKIQVNNFQNNLLDQSEELMKGKIYSYERGETSLLEVLNAQRTYNEIQTTYIETVHESYVFWIELEKAAGIWDINF